MRKGRRLLTSVILVGLLLSLAALTGCSRVTLYPITERDIVMLKEGETITAPKQGAFLSDLYIEEVMKVRIKNG
jgi:hypothetical protein